MPPQLRKRPAPPSDALPTVSQCRWELRRFATSHHCLEISTAKDSYSFLSSIGAYADLPRFFGPCTKSDSQSCHLLDQLDIWNQFLQEVGMLLEEVAPGTLSVAPQCRASDGLATEHCNPDGWVLLHWLFKKHHCIANLRLLSPNKRSQLHLGDAVSQNSGLRTLTLSYETSEEELRMIYSTVTRWTKLESLNISGLALSNDTAVLLEASLENLPSLRSLDVSFLSIAPACDAELLKGVFERMSVLTSLSLSYTFEPLDIELVLRCLRPGLSELSVDDSFLVPQEGAVFQEFLSGNTVLKKLTLIQKLCTGMGELDNVFKSLLVNHSLEELHLSNFGIENATMELLAEAVVEHSTLKILEVDFFDFQNLQHPEDFDECWEMDGTPLAKMLGQNKSIQELKFEVGEVACYEAFAEAVCKNTTLKKLSLNLVQLDDLAEIFVYRGFLEALSCNETIQQVTLGSIYSVLVSRFSELLRETGTERRVTFEVDLTDSELFTEALEKCSGLAEMRYSDWGSKIPVPPSAYRHLMRYYNLEDLDITLWDQLMDDEAVTALAEFLASTRTLQSVFLGFRTSPAATHALLESISCNRSISSLLISRWTFNELNANLLWQILRNTDILNDIFLSLHNNSDFQALSQFSERLLDNHSLLSADFSDFQNFKLKVKDVMRRNLSTLYRAVMFVMGSRGRRYAEAFERVSRSPALVKEVQKSASESKEDAKERVRWARDYLNQHFLAAAGVVKDTVTCTENGQLQLDQIDLDSWLHIRRYLKVADIKEPTGQPSMSRHLYKKRRSRR